MSLKRLQLSIVKTTHIGAITVFIVFTGAGSCWATSVSDLAGLGFDDLMNIELPSASDSARFQVSATAVDSCNVTATNLAFGNYDPLMATTNDQTTIITVTCTVDAAYIIGLDAGIGAGATVATRKMMNNANSLNYSLYKDWGRTLVWGNTAGTDTVTGIGTGSPIDYTVYGQIAAKQPVKRGTYLDTITVSVYY